MSTVKLAIIGAGPSAFYVASRLLSSRLLSLPQSPKVNVHMFDRLWAPHGLVRYGVAPDHPEVKNCTNKFDSVAADPRFRFFGNVNIGEHPPNPIPHALHLPLSAIFHHYTHILFATGCTLPTLHPSIPPSSHCTPALSLVHWYTQHPSRPLAPPLEKLSHVTLIGNGNVALDISRMLLSSPASLSKYDLPQPVLDVLSRSTVKHISIVGRRGPFEAAFTAKELREMMNLPEASMVPIEPSLLTPPLGTSLTRQQTRLHQLLQKGSKNAPGTTPKTWSLEFFRSPTALVPVPNSPLAKLTLAHTSLDPATRRAIPTGETSHINTSLVVTSLGFHGEPTTSFYDPALGHLRTVSDRVISSSGTVLKNMYASGWAATGAKGVLASTMMNAYAVADTILSDLLPNSAKLGITTELGGGAEAVLNPDPHPEDPPPEIVAGLREGVVTAYGDWKAVDAEEVRRGAVMGKERERMGWEATRQFLAKATPPVLSDESFYKSDTLSPHDPTPNSYLSPPRSKGI